MGRRQEPRFKRIDVPRSVIDLAHRRTEFLFRLMTFSDTSMRDVLASAYLQGIQDGAQALENRGAVKPLELISPIHC